MGIVYSKADRTFTIQTKNTTYQMQVDPYGFLLHLYYGKKTDGSCMDYLLTYYDRGFSGNPFDAGDDRTYSMDALPQEYPSYGTGDYRSTALIVENADGSTACDLRYRSHHIFNGKYKIPGLPAVYADETESQTLEIVMEDAVTGVEVTLQYGVLPDYDVITRSEKIVYRGEGKICIRKAQSACLDFVQGKYDLLTFYGRHAMERTMQREPVTHGSHVIGSVRGTSSHQYNPMMILADENTTDQYGNCYAMSFVYSGNFKGETLKDQFGQTRALMGLQDEMFSYPLAEGETFYTPEVLLTFSGSGMNLLSQNLHRCIRQHICRGKYKESVRPVLVNSWEASYFDFDGDTLYELAKEAKHAGIDMLVLDDGWFGKRDDDNSGLGDWFVNEKKLGGTLGDLIKKINDLGVKFGIWVEPEMISEDSDLYREHPDWALTIPGRNPVHARNQLVLDFSRKEVVDHIFDQICKVLDQGNIEYVKWDMNRFKEQSSFTTWLYRITTNVCSDILRKRQKHSGVISINQAIDEKKDMDIRDESPTPEENMEISERQRAVREAISELKEEYRTVITLCDIEGLSYDYIAEVLRIPSGTVKSRINRARSALKKNLMNKRELF